MSRLRRLKERKIKNKIKATSCGLALALVMGSSQGLGTYALFTDIEGVASDLAISTGDVDVEIEGEGFDITHYTNEEDYDEDKDDNCIDHDITGLSIVNKGTLNQNLIIGISEIDGITEDVAEKIEFDFEFCYCSENENNCNCDLELEKNLYELMGNTFIIKDGNVPFVLEPGQKLDIKGEIDVEILRKIDDINLELNVEAKQINSTGQISDYGFYDKASKLNTIKVVQEEDISIDTGEYVHYPKVHGNRFPKLFIPVEVKETNNEYELSAIAQSTDEAIGNYKATLVTDGGRKYILIENTIENGLLDFKGNTNITIIVTVKNNQGTVIDTYELECNVSLSDAGNSCKGEMPGHPHSVATGHCHAEIVNAGHIRGISFINENDKQPSQGLETTEPDVVEPPKEEVEVPSEPEIVEPPKEEVEVPSEPDVVDPPKEEEVPSEPDVVEPPKVEETVVPSQPDIIAPSKEEIEIQE